MDELGKFQPHQTAADKVVITFGLLFRLFSSPFLVTLIMLL